MDLLAADQLGERRGAGEGEIQIGGARHA